MKKKEHTKNELEILLKQIVCKNMIINHTPGDDTLEILEKTLSDQNIEFSYISHHEIPTIIEKYNENKTFIINKLDQLISIGNIDLCYTLRKILDNQKTRNCKLILIYGDTKTSDMLQAIANRCVIVNIEPEPRPMYTGKDYFTERFIKEFFELTKTDISELNSSMIIDRFKKSEYDELGYNIAKIMTTI